MPLRTIDLIPSRIQPWWFRCTVYRAVIQRLLPLRVYISVRSPQIANKSETTMFGYAAARFSAKTTPFPTAVFATFSSGPTPRLRFAKACEVNR